MILAGMLSLSAADPLMPILGARSEDDAFRNSVESITGPISRIISREGMPGVYAALDAAGKKEFERVRLWFLQWQTHACPACPAALCVQHGTAEA